MTDRRNMPEEPSSVVPSGQEMKEAGVPVQEAVPLSEGQSEDGRPGTMERSGSWELLKKAAAVEDKMIYDASVWSAFENGQCPPGHYCPSRCPGRG